MNDKLENQIKKRRKHSCYESACSSADCDWRIGPETGILLQEYSDEIVRLRTALKKAQAERNDYRARAEVEANEGDKARKELNEAEKVISEIRDVIPMDFLRANDKPGATGPTEDLNLVQAVRDMVAAGRKAALRNPGKGDR